jgi:DNA-binding transcriptional LysR family regulator
VSGQVRDLEREIGVTLLHRNQREVSLTAEGALFLPEAREILAHSNRAIEMIVRASQGSYGALSVGLCGPATAPFLPGLIREFRKRQPGVAVTLKDLDPAQQPAALASQVIDIGFTRNVPPEFRKSLSSEVFFREPLIAALCKHHPLAEERAIQLAQLAADPFILHSRVASPELFDAIISLCRKAKFSPRVVDSPTSWQTVLTLVEAGEGVALIPACVQQLCSNGVVFRPLRGRGLLLDVVLAWRREEPNSIRDGFLNLLRKSRTEIERMMQNAA